MELYNDLLERRIIIMEHYHNPRNKIDNDLVKDYIFDDVESNKCNDKIRVFLKVYDSKIDDIKFKGYGCAISIASTDLLIEELRNKEQNKAKELINSYLKMLETGNFDKSLNKLNIFRNVKNHFNRLNCAKLSAITILKLLK